MKKVVLSSLLMAVTMLTSCDGDYGWDAQPQSSSEETMQTVAFGDGSVTEVPTINLGEIKTELVKVCDIKAIEISDPEASLKGYTIYLGPDFKTSYELSKDGSMNRAELASVVEALYGKRPVERTIEAYIRGYVSKNGQVVLANSSKFNIRIIPDAPFISSKYYLILNMNNTWNVDMLMPFEHSSADVYEDPVFTLIFETEADNQYWKIIPQSNLDAGGVWALENVPNGVVGVETEGDESMSGTLLTTTSEGKKANAGRIAKAGKYIMTINMMDYTYTIMPYVPQYYLVGSLQGWSDKLMTCMFYPQSENVHSYTTQWNGDANLKIWQKNDFGVWDNALGCEVDGSQDMEGLLLKNAQAIKCPEPGSYYTLTIDIKSKKYKWTKLSNQTPASHAFVGIIGSDGKWGDNDDIAMTQVTPHNWYAGNVTLKDAIKFRANHQWDVEWGAENASKENWTPADFYGKGVKGGGNIKVPTGQYDVFLNDITGEYAIVRK